MDSSAWAGQGAGRERAGMGRRGQASGRVWAGIGHGLGKDQVGQDRAGSRQGEGRDQTGRDVRALRQTLSDVPLLLLSWGFPGLSDSEARRYPGSSVFTRTSNPPSFCAFQQRPVCQWLIAQQVLVGIHSRMEHPRRKPSFLSCLLDCRDGKCGSWKKSHLEKLKGLVGEQGWFVK